MENLFSELPLESSNLLPYDGTVLYYGRVFSVELANQYLQYLLESIPWKNDEAIIFGKKIITKRMVAWYGTSHFEYQYSKITKRAALFTPELMTLKNEIELLSNSTYNSCLLNLYHDGSEGMAWHSDGETDLLKHGAIASVTFGAERKFSFKHKQTNETVSIQLEHGSLLVMKDQTQTHWLHRLPPTTKVQQPRVNLTFRTIIK